MEPVGWLTTISFGLICAFILWRIYRVIKENPEVVSKQNLTKSFTSMGLLALVLIGFVAILVALVRQ